MTSDAFMKRATTLEDEFFHRVDEELTRKLKEKWQHERDLETLKQESRIDDVTVLEEMLAAGIHTGMIQVMTLVPAIHVAWANEFVENKERAAVLQAAESIGITAQSTPGQLLISWLDNKPSAELFKAWRDYVGALHKVLDADSCSQLRKNAVDTARRIAESAGGYLGIQAVSAAEEHAIREIDQAFNPE